MNRSKLFTLKGPSMSKVRFLRLLAMAVLVSGGAKAATPPPTILVPPPVNLMITWSPIQQQYYFWPSDANGIPEVDVIAGGTGGSGGGSGGTAGAITAANASFAAGFSPDIGTTGDTAWGGTGNGSLLAISKDIALEVATLDSVAADERATLQPFSVSAVNATYSIALAYGENTVGFQLTGLTASGATLAIEGSKDGGTTWYSKGALSPSTNGAPVNSIAVDGPLSIDVAGLTNIRLRVSTAGTGNVTVSYSASLAVGVVSVGSALPPGGNLIGGVNLVATAGADVDYTPVTVTTSSTTVIPAAATSRARAVINNNSTAAVMWCRADGNTAVVGTGLQLGANGGWYEWDAPTVGTAAINCIMASGSATATGEYHQQ